MKLECFHWSTWKTYNFSRIVSQMSIHLLKTLHPLVLVLSKGGEYQRTSHVLKAKAMEEDAMAEMLDAFCQLDADDTHQESTMQEQASGQDQQQNSREQTSTEQEEAVMHNLAHFSTIQRCKDFCIACISCNVKLAIYLWMV